LTPGERQWRTGLREAKGGAAALEMGEPVCAVARRAGGLAISSLSHDRVFAAPGRAEARPGRGPVAVGATITATDPELFQALPMGTATKRIPCADFTRIRTDFRPPDWA
jgi:hypothetical protein